MELNTPPARRAVYLVSLGCAKNLVDSEVIQGVLAQAGYGLTTKKSVAEIIIVNTCAFIEEATREAIDTILTLAREKKTGACRHLIVCGCLPQRYKESLVQELPEVDLFLGTGEFQHIARHIQKLESGRQKKNIFTEHETFLLTPATPRLLATPRYTAYVKIAEGCSHRCTYCTILKIRGPYKSRPPLSILAEVKDLTCRGVKEINLIAQDTTQYGLNSTYAAGLAGLLKKLVRVPDLRWIRLLYCHPLNITPELISLLASEQKICSYLDLPLQHMSDPVLKRMGRRITGQRIEKLLCALRETVPDIALRTTFMVGFPGETARDFATLLQFVSAFEFEHLGVFRYRDEEGTPASKLSPRVPEKVKEERYHAIMGLQAKISRRKNRGRTGQHIDVLVEGPSQKKGFALQGRAVFQAPEVDGVVYIKSGKSADGSFVKVKITGGFTYDLAGEIVE
jgi:ribosomal protein S12 methylthiotransferase